MKYLSIELKGYKRLQLNINYIKINFTEKIQVILGTNGSGKTSLLRELTHLPSNKQNFTDDGYKIVTSLYKGDIYVSKSSFNPDKHSLSKNGIEIHNGTASVQKELVKQIFGLTPEIHELMLGNIKFHEMTGGLRRYWFTKLSNTNYDYALYVYNKLKEEERDISGTIKLLSNRLVQEVSNILTEDKLNVINEEVIQLRELLNLCLDNKHPITTQTNIIVSKLNQIETIIKNRNIEFKELISLIHKFKSNVSLDILTLEDIDDKILNNISDINGLKLISNQLSSDILDKQSLVEKLTKHESNNIADIENSLNKHYREVESLNKKITTGIEIKDPNNSFTALNNIYHTLLDIFSEIDKTSDKRYNRDYYITLTNKRNEIEKTLIDINKLQIENNTKKDKIDSIKKHNFIECPKCNNKWINNYDHDSYLLLIKNIELTGSEIIKVQNELINITKDIENTDYYFSLFNNYNDIKKIYNVLKPLWNYITDNQLLLIKPSECKSLLESFRNDLETTILIKDKKEKIKELEQLKSIALKVDSLTTERLKEEIEISNQKLFNINKETINLNIELNDLRNQKIRIVKLKELSKDIEINTIEYEKQSKLLIENIRKEAINDCINKIKLELTNKESLLVKANNQSNIIADIKKQIEDYKDKHEVLKIVVKELSPTEGLIAKGLLSFINSLISKMNSFISKIWLYPLSIDVTLPSINDDIELDFKFPLTQNDDYSVSDISKGSASMCDIINLAFNLVSMSYLNLNSFPIYLDEFGKTFDSAHREAAFNSINKLVQYSEIEQVFIVSHFLEHYGSFNNAEFTVLSEANLMLPNECLYNKHVEIN